MEEASPASMISSDSEKVLRLSLLLGRAAQGVGICQVSNDLDAVSVDLLHSLMGSFGRCFGAHGLS